MANQYIYSRVSTEQQATENQTHSLKRMYPEAIIIEETVSGASDVKPELDALLGRLQSGDVLVVAALDRLGRRAGKAITLIDDLYSKGIRVISVREGLDYSTPSGKLVGQITFAVSEMERNLISERTKAALKRLKEQGVKIGRPSTYPPEQIAKVLELRAQGLALDAIVAATGVKRARVGQLIKGIKRTAPLKIEA